MNEESRKIYKYAHPNSVGLAIVAGILIFVYPVLLLGVAWESGNLESTLSSAGGLLAVLFMPAAAVIWYLVWYFGKTGPAHFKKQFQALEQDPALCADFENGYRFMEDSFRVGETFVFARWEGIFKVSEISELHFSWTPEGPSEDADSGRASLDADIIVNGKKRRLGHTTSGDFTAQYYYITDRFLQVDPNIRVH